MTILLPTLLATLATTTAGAQAETMMDRRPMPSSTLVETATVASTPSIPIPYGLGKYCSITYPDGRWAFSFTDANKDPCADMLASTPGGTVKRAGLWDGKGRNNVVYQCAGGGIGLIKEEGEKALRAAFDDASGQKSCVFTVAPFHLPIFRHPFPTRSDISLTNGFDFAHGFKVKDQSGVEQDAVDYKGRSRNINGHAGLDWIMPTGTPLVAMAKGKVFLTRTRDVGLCDGKAPDEPIQKEVFVMHVVGSGRYKEIFVAYYAHLDKISVKSGDLVEAGEKLGEAGDTGCSEPSHLHLGVIRGSNTAAHYRVNLDAPTANGYAIQTEIDPYGFSWFAKAGFDPWAWRAMNQGHGALSISLWRTDMAPKRN